MLFSVWLSPPHVLKTVTILRLTLPHPEARGHQTIEMHICTLGMGLAVEIAFYGAVCGDYVFCESTVLPVTVF